jgi:hypothetical protein
MPTKRRLVKRAPFNLDVVLADYLTHRSLAERSSYHESQGKKALMGYLETTGDLDGEGHRTVHLDDPLPFTEYKQGKPAAKVVTAIKRQRRSSKALDAEKTLAYLREHDLLDKCTVKVVEIDEEAILGANYTGEISDEDLEGLYVENETFAFILEKEDA